MSSPAAKTRDSRAAKFNRRKLVNKLMLSLSMAAMAFGVFWLLWILMDTVRLGIGGLSVETLTAMTPAPNDPGGIANAMYGSFLMVLVATFIGTPIGIMAGIYLGLVLFIITFIVLSLSKLLLMRLRRNEGRTS